MKAIAISFTITMMDLHKRRVALVDIDEFHVGCLREHLFPCFPNQNLVPMEVTWLNEQSGYRSWYGEKGLSMSPDFCDSQALKTWETLRQWMVEKDGHGKMKYQIGNYPEAVCRELLAGNRVWYSGEWAKLEDVSEWQLEEALKRGDCSPEKLVIRRILDERLLARKGNQ